MNTYKKYISHCIAFMAICLIVGCDNNIDLNADGIISVDGYFTSPEDYEKALNSCYARLNHNGYDQWMG